MEARGKWKWLKRDNLEKEGVRLRKEALIVFVQLTWEQGGEGGEGFVNFFENQQGIREETQGHCRGKGETKEQAKQKRKKSLIWEGDYGLYRLKRRCSTANGKYVSYVEFK